MTDIRLPWGHPKIHVGPELLSDVGSATDVRLIDVARTVDEGGTHPWVAAEQLRRSYPQMPRTVEDVSSIAALAQKQGEATFASMGDFAALDESRTPEGQIRRRIRSLRGAARLAYRERLARRLEFLLETMKEEGEAWKETSPESLRKMLLFLQSLPNFRYPSVTVTPSATFRAQWTADPSRHFAVDFLPDGQVRFVTFCPDPRHPDRIQRISGITSWENVVSVVEPCRVHRWAADAWG
jgi:hypothetical protein